VTGVQTCALPICYTFSKDGKPGPVSTKLYNHLRAIQYGIEEDKHGWTTVVIE
jgi:branched-chain amino acid aminotransferase